MFQSDHDGNSFTITANNQKVIGDILLKLSLDQTGCIDLHLSEQKVEEKADQFGTYTNYKYVYSENNRISLSFILKCYENFVFAYTDVSLLSEKTFGRNEYLSSENGVVIHVSEVGHIQGLMANYRHKDWWTRPYFHRDVTTLPDRTQSLLWRTGGSYYHLLPVCDSIYKSELRGAKQGFDISLSSYDGGHNRCYSLAFVLGKGENPFLLSKQMIQKATEIQGKTRTIEEKRYPEILDYFGWCSWDAFYHEVDEAGILEKTKELRKKQVPAKWIMIDDGWSNTDEERLCSFDADAVKFPNGLQHVAEQLKNLYGIKSIGVWHTFAGYWGGIDPNSDLASQMANHLYETNSQKIIPYPDSGRGYGFWNAWHSYLSQQGIDFVKVDGQSAVNNFMMQQMPVGVSANESHKALEASVGIHFDHCMINCMGMAPENFWNRPISSVSRSSDDFVPEDDGGFAEHALQNVYNSYYHGELYWGDWDMFWTQHKDAHRHALLRAVSGGPIYTSDPVDQTDPDILLPLMYRDGRILRCDQPGRPTEDTLTKDPTEEKVPLKVWNVCGDAGILAAYNIHKSGKQVQGSISPSDIEGCQNGSYIIYDYFNKRVYDMKYDQKRKISLDKEEFSLYIILPKRELFTPIGLINKYIAPATYSFQYETNEQVVVQIREGGTFAFIAETEPSSVKVNGWSTSFYRLNERQSIYAVDCSSYSESILVEIKK